MKKGSEPHYLFVNSEDVSQILAGNGIPAEHSQHEFYKDYILDQMKGTFFTSPEEMEQSILNYVPKVTSLSFRKKRALIDYITRQQIRRLYKQEVKGIYDEELMDEIISGFLMTCHDLLDIYEGDQFAKDAFNILQDAATKSPQEKMIAIDQVLSYAHATGTYINLLVINGTEEFLENLHNLERESLNMKKKAQPETPQENFYEPGKSDEYPKGPKKPKRRFPFYNYPPDDQGNIINADPSYSNPMEYDTLPGAPPQGPGIFGKLNMRKKADEIEERGINYILEELGKQKFELTDPTDIEIFVGEIASHPPGFAFGPSIHDVNSLILNHMKKFPRSFIENWEIYFAEEYGLKESFSKELATQILGELLEVKPSTEQELELTPLPEFIKKKPELTEETMEASPYAELLRKYTADEIYDIASGRKEAIPEEVIQAKEVITRGIVANRLSMRKEAQIDKQMFFDFYGVSLLSNQYLETNPYAKEYKDTVVQEIKDVYVPLITKMCYSELEKHKNKVYSWWDHWLVEFDIRKVKDLSLEQLARVYNEGDWKREYGGEAWGSIVESLIQLKNTTDTNQLITIIDHINDIQHNTGLMFHDFPKVEKWFSNALDVKAQSTPEGLIPYLSTDLQKLVTEDLKLRGQEVVAPERYISVVEKREQASNPNTPPEILAELAKDEDKYVRDRVAGNPNTPPEIKEQLEKQLHGNFNLNMRKKGKGLKEYIRENIEEQFIIPQQLKLRFGKVAQAEFNIGEEITFDTTRYLGRGKKRVGGVLKGKGVITKKEDDTYSIEIIELTEVARDLKNIFRIGLTAEFTLDEIKLEKIEVEPKKEIPTPTEIPPEFEPYIGDINFHKFIKQKGYDKKMAPTPSEVVKEYIEWLATQKLEPSVPFEFEEEEAPTYELVEGLEKPTEKPDEVEEKEEKPFWKELVEKAWESFQRPVTKPFGSKLYMKKTASVFDKVKEIELPYGMKAVPHPQSFDEKLKKKYPGRIWFNILTPKGGVHVERMSMDNLSDNTEEAAKQIWTEYTKNAKLDDIVNEVILDAVIKYWGEDSSEFDYFMKFTFLDQVQTNKLINKLYELEIDLDYKDGLLHNYTVPTKEQLFELKVWFEELSDKPESMILDVKTLEDIEKVKPVIEKVYEQHKMKEEFEKPIEVPYANLLNKYTEDEIFDIAAGRKDATEEEVEQAKEVITRGIVANRLSMRKKASVDEHEYREKEIHQGKVPTYTFKDFQEGLQGEKYILINCNICTSTLMLTAKEVKAYEYKIEGLPRGWEQEVKLASLKRAQLLPQEKDFINNFVKQFERVHDAEYIYSQLQDETFLLHLSLHLEDLGVSKKRSDPLAIEIYKQLITDYQFFTSPSFDLLDSTEKEAKMSTKKYKGPIKSILEDIAQDVWTATDLETAKNIIITKVENSKIDEDDKRTIINTTNGIDNLVELQKYIANSILFYEGMGTKLSMRKKAVSDSRVIDKTILYFEDNDLPKTYESVYAFILEHYPELSTWEMERLTEKIVNTTRKQSMRKKAEVIVEGSPPGEGSWAMYQGNVYVTYDKNKRHAVWFEELGIPSAGVEYDNIVRGYFVDDRNYIGWYGTGDYNEFYNHLGELKTTLGYPEDSEVGMIDYTTQELQVLSMRKKATVPVPLRMSLDYPHSWPQKKKKKKDEKKEALKTEADLKSSILSLLLVGATISGIADMIGVPQKQVEQTIQSYPEYFEEVEQPEFAPLPEYVVTATIYHAVPEQTSTDPEFTADMTRIDPDNVPTAEGERIIALSRDLLKKFTPDAPFDYGDKVLVEGAGEMDGLWVIHDTMNARFSNTIDFLVPKDITTGKWENVKINKVQQVEAVLNMRKKAQDISDPNKLSIQELKRFYELEPKGLLDEEFVDDVLSKLIYGMQKEKERVLEDPEIGNYPKKDFVAVVEFYINELEKIAAKSLNEKIIEIDQTIHALHLSHGLGVFQGDFGEIWNTIEFIGEKESLGNSLNMRKKATNVSVPTPSDSLHEQQGEQNSGHTYFQGKDRWISREPDQGFDIDFPSKERIKRSPWPFDDTTPTSPMMASLSMRKKAQNKLTLEELRRFYELEVKGLLTDEVVDEVISKFIYGIQDLIEEIPKIVEKGYEEKIIQDLREEISFFEKASLKSLNEKIIAVDQFVHRNHIDGTWSFMDKSTSTEEMQDMLGDVFFGEDYFTKLSMRKIAQVKAFYVTRLYELEYKMSRLEQKEELTDSENVYYLKMKNEINALLDYTFQKIYKGLKTSECPECSWDDPSTPSRMRALTRKMKKVENKPIKERIVVLQEVISSAHDIDYLWEWVITSPGEDELAKVFESDPEILAKWDEELKKLQLSSEYGKYKKEKEVEQEDILDYCRDQINKVLGQDFENWKNKVAEEWSDDYIAHDLGYAPEDILDKQEKDTNEFFDLLQLPDKEKYKKYYKEVFYKIVDENVDYWSEYQRKKRETLNGAVVRATQLVDQGYNNEEAFSIILEEFNVKEKDFANSIWIAMNSARMTLPRNLLASKLSMRKTAQVSLETLKQFYTDMGTEQYNEKRLQYILDEWSKVIEKGKFKKSFRDNILGILGGPGESNYQLSMRIDQVIDVLHGIFEDFSEYRYAFVSGNEEEIDNWFDSPASRGKEASILSMKKKAVITSDMLHNFYKLELQYREEQDLIIEKRLDKLSEQIVKDLLILLNELLDIKPQGSSTQPEVEENLKLRKQELENAFDINSKMIAIDNTINTMHYDWPMIKHLKYQHEEEVEKELGFEVKEDPLERIVFNESWDNLIKFLKEQGKITQEASILDYPQKHLDSAMWDLSGDLPKLKENVKGLIVERFLNYLREEGKLNNPELWCTGFYYTGSTATYRYRPTTDIDIHVKVDWEKFKKSNPDKAKDDIEEMHKELLQVFWNTLNKEVLLDTQHPLTYYVLSERENVFEMGEEAYDILNDSWIVPPHKLPENLDIDEKIELLGTQANAIMERLDEELGKTKRDFIDYKILKELLDSYKGDKKDIQKLIEKKLDDVESRLKGLQEENVKIHDERQKAFHDGQEPIEEGLSQNWAPGNIIFKLIEKYRYMDVLRKIKHIIEDDKITEDEEKQLEDILEPKLSMRKRTDIYPSKPDSQVTKQELKRLYIQNAKGIYDEEAIDAVVSEFIRVLDILIERFGGTDDDDLLVQVEQIIVFISFLKQAKTPQEKMIIIDQVIHTAHYSGEYVDYLVVDGDEAFLNELSNLKVSSLSMRKTAISDMEVPENWMVKDKTDKSLRRTNPPRHDKNDSIVEHNIDPRIDMASLNMRKRAQTVTKQELKKLYIQEAKGIYDEELMDEIISGFIVTIEQLQTESDKSIKELRDEGIGKEDMERQEQLAREEFGRLEDMFDVLYGAYTPQEKMLAIDTVINIFHEMGKYIEYLVVDGDEAFLEELGNLKISSLNMRKAFYGQPTDKNYNSPSLLLREDMGPSYPSEPAQAEIPGTTDDDSWGESNKLKKKRPTKEKIFPDFQTTYKWPGGEVGQY